MMKDLVREDVLASDVAEGSTVALYRPPLSQRPVLSSAQFTQALLPDEFHGKYRLWGKRFVDIALVVLTLPLTGPLIALCALALWIEGGSPFYWQDRLGLRGQRFRILKLRTMVRDADAQLAEHLAGNAELQREWDTTQKLKHDPRITPIGRILRASSIDELPQIWNVLLGDMSLVGPRPMMPEQLPLYGDPRAYFKLRPGITGAWQVAARNERGFESRKAFDADYHTYHCLKEDVLIMWQTIFVVLKRTGY